MGGWSWFVMRVHCVIQGDPSEGSARRGGGATREHHSYKGVSGLHYRIRVGALFVKPVEARMSSVGLLAFFGGLIGAYQLVKLVWRCWCGFRQFVLSAFWQVDLRSYGKWAGRADACTRG